MHGVRLFRKLLHHPSGTVGVLLLFSRFLLREKPRHPDVNMVLMGKRFGKEASLMSALRTSANKLGKNAHTRKKLLRISSNETTSASRKRGKKERESDKRVMHEKYISLFTSFIVNYIQVFLSRRALLLAILYNTFCCLNEIVYSS